MSARRARDLSIGLGAGATAAGLAAGLPEFGIAGSLVAAVAAMWRVGARAPAPAGPATAGEADRPTTPEAGERHVFRASRDDETPPGTLETGGRTPGESGEAGRTSGSSAYEEFAAGLDSDDDDISFLPPYSSGSAADDDEDPGAGPRATTRPRLPSESAVLRELRENLENASNLPAPRHFALGIVAILRNVLDPPDVERILVEQRRFPALRFGDAAIQLGLIDEAQRDELVTAQQDGVFSDEEIRDAIRRLSAAGASPEEACRESA